MTPEFSSNLWIRKEAERGGGDGGILQEGRHRMIGNGAV